jgi:anti-sigma-K factor RskA
MPIPDLEKRALAAGFVTDTLDDAERVQAEAMLLSDGEFMSMVQDCRTLFEAEDKGALPERLWQNIERRLTGRQK